MSFVEDVFIASQDSASVDAFGRWRVSEINSQLDLKQLHDSLPLFYNIEEIGTGTATHSESEARTQLSTAANSDAVIIQTKQRANYSSGKSQQIFWTFDTFDIETNVTKRVGYFTHLTSSSPYDSTKDGLWLESSGAEVSINIQQSGVVTESTGQSSWNLDTLDGNGPSGLTWDWDQNTILLVDFEWLGVGRVRWGVVYNGMPIYFHESNHTQVAGTGVYMSSPNQPIRAEIRQSGAGSGTFNFICASVGSEGANNVLGKILSYDQGTTDVDCQTAGTEYAIIGIRLQDTKADTLVDILSYSILASTNDDFRWRILLNPTLSGTFTYSSISNSSIQTARSNTGNGNAATVSSAGTVIDSGYQTGNTDRSFEIKSALRLGMDIDFTVDEIVLAITPISNGLDIRASETWRERI